MMSLRYQRMSVCPLSSFKYLMMTYFMLVLYVNDMLFLGSKHIEPFLKTKDLVLASQILKINVSKE